MTTPAVRRRRGRRRHRRPRHRARRGPLRALGRRRRARAAPRHPPDGPQLQRHPLRALLRARWAEGAARRRGVRGDRRVLPRARPAAPGVRQARRRHRARRAAADGGARPPRRRQRRREPRARPGGHARPRAARARDRRAVRALHRDLRLPGGRREARRAGRQGGRRDPPRPVGHQPGPPPRRRGRPHATAATCSAPRSWRARACTATSWPGPRGPTPACGSCRSAASTPGFSERAAALVQGPDLPGARPGVPVPRACTPPAASTGSVHAGPNAVLALAREGYWLGHGEAHGAARDRSPTRACSGSRGSTGATGSARCTGRCRRRRWSARSSGCCPTSGPTTCARPGPGVRAQAVQARRHAGRRLPVRRAGLAAPGAVLHVLNAPSPAATAALPIGREILDGESWGP